MSAFAVAIGAKRTWHIALRISAYNSRYCEKRCQPFGWPGGKPNGIVKGQAGACSSVLLAKRQLTFEKDLLRFVVSKISIGVVVGVSQEMDVIG